ncbi:ester cyclase [Gloeocapsopsis dulcis]|uniref:Ester cyclase n=1 Tax=Gloeocapsopsis dulcis AAB1 = 1H9 TaxID=1433147 RepID=A0A6N8FU48_9CHRO|nr:ester cyclase [Gloeocapsopsis dulcis]MUL36471.1 ester cyclase [Gloeocapsopsis dulcis AAB1 = 1H9]WNN87760.1 ester cyclase [Gloeocapsopsis dulcis]
MTLEENKSIVLQAYDAFDRGDIKQGRALIAPDITGCVMGSHKLKGADAFFEYAMRMRGAFPDGRHTFEDVIAEDDKVVTRGTFSGTHLAEIMGVSPTGKQVTFSIVHIDRVVKGKVVEHWGQADMVALMQQLGIEKAIAR